MKTITKAALSLLRLSLESGNYNEMIEAADFLIKQCSEEEFWEVKCALQKLWQEFGNENVCFAFSLNGGPLYESLPFCQPLKFSYYSYEYE